MQLPNRSINPSSSSASCLYILLFCPAHSPPGVRLTASNFRSTQALPSTDYFLGQQLIVHLARKTESHCRVKDASSPQSAGYQPCTSSKRWAQSLRSTSMICPRSLYHHSRGRCQCMILQKRTEHSLLRELEHKSRQTGLMVLCMSLPSMLTSQQILASLNIPLRGMPPLLHSTSPIKAQDLFC